MDISPIARSVEVARLLALVPTAGSAEADMKAARAMAAWEQAVRTRFAASGGLGPPSARVWDALLVAVARRSVDAEPETFIPGWTGGAGS